MKRRFRKTNQRESEPRDDLSAGQSAPNEPGLRLVGTGAQSEWSAGMNNPREGTILLTFENRDEEILLSRWEAWDLSKWVCDVAGIDSHLPRQLHDAVSSENRTVTLSDADCDVLRHVPELMIPEFSLTGLGLLARFLGPRIDLGSRR